MSSLSLGNRQSMNGTWSLLSPIKCLVCVSPTVEQGRCRNRRRLWNRSGRRRGLRLRPRRRPPGPSSLITRSVLVSFSLIRSSPANQSIPCSTLFWIQHPQGVHRCWQSRQGVHGLFVVQIYTMIFGLDWERMRWLVIARKPIRDRLLPPVPCVHYERVHLFDFTGNEALTSFVSS